MGDEISVSYIELGLALLTIICVLIGIIFKIVSWWAEDRFTNIEKEMVCQQRTLVEHSKKHAAQHEHNKHSIQSGG